MPYKVDFAAFMLEAAFSLQIEARGKIMGALNFWGHNLLKSVFQFENFFQLTTPNDDFNKTVPNAHSSHV